MGDLWPGQIESHRAALAGFGRGESVGIDQFFVCEADDGQLLGFIELRIRDYAEGSSSFKVPFVEGWYVRPDSRRRGLGAALMAEAEAWAKESGYSELASNTELGNALADAAHKALGFDEIERTINYLKKLDSDGQG